MGINENREAALRALSELKSIHQGIGSNSVRWRRCKPGSKQGKKCEDVHDKLSRRSAELSDLVGSFIRFGVA